jgi:GntP family gluconate:H+ symporter
MGVDIAAIGFLGNKNVAMFIGTMIAVAMWARRNGWGIREAGDAMGQPLQIAGVIILITCAGGAFGAMIKLSGIGDAIKWATAGFTMSSILLAWLIAAVMKVAQGSGTVSMITTSSIMFALIGDGAGLPYHPVYILLAIGFGAMVVSWMNDSGFWVVARLSGFTERETLQSWTVTLGVIGVVGLVQVLIVAAVFPLAR